MSATTELQLRRFRKTAAATAMASGLFLATINVAGAACGTIENSLPHLPAQVQLAQFGPTTDLCKWVIKEVCRHVAGKMVCTKKRVKVCTHKPGGGPNLPQQPPAAK